MKSISGFLILFTVLGFCSAGQSIIDLFIEKNHSSAVIALAYSQKGDLVASTGGGTVIIRNAETGRYVREITGIEEGLFALAFSPDGTILAGGESDNKNSRIWLWDARSGELKQTLTGHKKGITGLAFSPDGKILASRDYGDKLILWNLETGDPKLTKEVSYYPALAFSNDGKMIAASKGPPFLLDAKTGEPILQDKVFQWPKDVGDLDKLSFTPDGKALIGLYLSNPNAESNIGVIRFWSTETGDVMREGILTGHKSELRGGAISPDGSMVATGSGATKADSLINDSNVRLWDAQGKLIRVMDEKHVSGVSNLVFSPDGSKLLTGSGFFGSSNIGKAELIMWNAKTGKIEWAIGRKCSIC